MANVNAQEVVLPEDQAALRVLVQSLLQEREQHQQWTAEQRRQTAQLQAEILRSQVELERYKRWYYGPRADRLRTAGELAQLLLQFAEELDQKPSPLWMLSSRPSLPSDVSKGGKADAIWPALRTCR